MVRLKRAKPTCSEPSGRMKFHRAERSLELLPEAERAYELIFDGVSKATRGDYSQIESRMRDIGLSPEEKIKVKCFIESRKADVCAEVEHASKAENDPLVSILRNGKIKEKLLALAALTTSMSFLADEAYEKFASTSGLGRAFNICKYNFLAGMAVVTSILSTVAGIASKNLAAIPTMMLTSLIIIPFALKNYKDAVKERAEQRKYEVIDAFSSEVDALMQESKTANLLLGAGVESASPREMPPTDGPSLFK
jgi:hypothetical protein